MSRGGRIAVLVAAAISLLLVAPAMTALFSSLTHSSAEYGDTGQGGFITVKSCARRTLLITWECRGTFQVDDPYEGYGYEDNVSVPNDIQRHAIGSKVGVDLIRRDHTAYYFNDAYNTLAAVAAAGVVLCVISASLIWLSRKKRTHIIAAVMVGVGCLFILPVALMVLGLVHPTARYVD